jgi:hypothetical protein
MSQTLGLRIGYLVRDTCWNLVVLFDVEDARPRYGIRLVEDCPAMLLRAFDEANSINSVFWPDREDMGRGQRVGDSFVEVSVRGHSTRIHLYLEWRL